MKNMRYFNRKINEWKIPTATNTSIIAAVKYLRKKLPVREIKWKHGSSLAGVNRHLTVLKVNIKSIICQQEMHIDIRYIA